MTAQSKTKQKILLPLLIVTVLLLSGITAFFVYDNYFATPVSLSPYNVPADDGLMDADIKRLSTETYESALLSMHSNASFSEDDFKFYRGLDTVVTEHAILNTVELSEYLQCILSSGNTLSTIYLCPDPERLWIESEENPENWTELLSAALYGFIENYPHITFEILLPYPHMDYWLSLSEEDFETILTLYHTLVCEVSAYANTVIYFPGYEEWLMVNPDNYTGTLFDVNPIVAQQIFLLSLCDGVYEITPDNDSFFRDSLRATVSAERENPAHYPDLSDWDIVFFGDSVIGNYQGSPSQPGYVTGLSHATTHNLAVGGASAGLIVPGPTTFEQALDNFFAPPIAFEQTELCFVINFGFNDYFCGIPTDNPENAYDTFSFAGGLRTGIRRLQEAYPDAHYIIVSPTHTDRFETGTQTLSDTGSPLADYVSAAKQVAQEMNTYFIDNYNDSVITPDTFSEYLSDGVHPNENGHLTLARILMRFIETNLINSQK